jgi:hypothetical protein
MPFASLDTKSEGSGRRLFGSYTLVPVLIDAEPLDLRLQCLPWNAASHGSAGRSAYPPTVLRKSRFVRLQFTIWQPRARFMRA